MMPYIDGPRLSILIFLSRFRKTASPNCHRLCFEFVEYLFKITALNLFIVTAKTFVVFLSPFRLIP